MAASTEQPAVKLLCDSLKPFIQADYLGGHSQAAVPALHFLHNFSKPTAEHRRWNVKELEFQAEEAKGLKTDIGDFEFVDTDDLALMAQDAAQRHILSAWKTQRIVIPFHSPLELTDPRFAGRCTHPSSLGQQYLDVFTDPISAFQRYSLVRGQIDDDIDAPAGLTVRLRTPADIYNVSCSDTNYNWFYASDVSHVGEPRYRLPCRPRVALAEKKHVYVYFDPKSAIITGIWEKTQPARSLIDDASQKRLRHIAQKLKLPIEDVKAQGALYPLPDVVTADLYDSSGGSWWAHTLRQNGYLYVLSGPRGAAVNKDKEMKPLTGPERVAIQALAKQMESQPSRGRFYHEPRHTRMAEFCRPRYSSTPPTASEKSGPPRLVMDLPYCEGSKPAWVGKK